MRFFSLATFFSRAVAAFKRFPFTLIWAVASAITIIIIVDAGERAFEANGNLILICILGISWLIGTQFYIEQFKKKGLWWIKLIIVGLLITFYFTLPEYEVGRYDREETPYIRWTLYFLAGHIALFFAPFITVWHPKAYWNYLSNMLIAIARSTLFSGVLYLGLVLAMLAVQFLFDYDIKEIRYFQLFVICLGIVNTWVYLADFPMEIQHDIHMSFHTPIAVFVKFILIPLAGLYIAILYAYTLKIIFLWELPEGWVSYLVTALAALLFIIQIIIHPVRLSHSSSVIRNFQPYFYWAFIPLLPLLYVAIYRRIADYGVTEARYFLVVVAIFITVSTFYLVFSRKQQLRFLPMSLAVLAIVTSFGFWGAFSVSERSQLRQFEEVYNALAKPVLSGVEVLDSSTISRETADRFLSISKFLKNRNALAATERIIGYNPIEAFPTASSWSIGDRILDSLGLKISRYKEGEKFLSFYSDDSGAIIVTGYDFYKSMYFNANTSYNNPENILEGCRFSLDGAGTSIQITYNQSQELGIPMARMISDLVLDTYGSGEVAQERLTLIAENDSLSVKIVFKQLDLKKINSTYSLNYCEADVLLKQKQ